MDLNIIFIYLEARHHNPGALYATVSPSIYLLLELLLSTEDIGTFYVLTIFGGVSIVSGTSIYYFYFLFNMF